MNRTEKLKLFSESGCSSYPCAGCEFLQRVVDGIVKKRIICKFETMSEVKKYCGEELKRIKIQEILK